ETRRQKHDRRDAALLLDLLTTDRFPSIWMPSTELRDLRALLLHRQQWVRIRTRVMNALQGLALGQGIRRRAALWSRAGQALLASLTLGRMPICDDRSCRRSTGICMIRSTSSISASATRRMSDRRPVVS